MAARSVRAPTRCCSAAIVNVLFADGLVDPGRHVARHARRPRRGRRRDAQPFTPEAVAPATGIDADDDPPARARARRRADGGGVRPHRHDARPEFGTLASWLVDVLNVCTGNLDRPGGAMFPTPAAGGADDPRASPAPGRGFAIGRGAQPGARAPGGAWASSRSAALAEEIDDAGRRPDPGARHHRRQPGAVDPERRRGSTPRSTRSSSWCRVDIYLNETTRHADVILPPPSPLRSRHYDLALLQLAVRNVANYSPPVLPLDDGQPDEWEILAKLASIVAGHGRRRRSGRSSTTSTIVELIDTQRPTRPSSDVSRPRRRTSCSPSSTRRATGPSGCSTSCCAPVRTATDSARTRTARRSTTCSNIPTASTSGRSSLGCRRCCARRRGMIELAARAARRRPRSAARPRSTNVESATGCVLVGRRHLRSNNSWMHNVEVLVKGKPRCTLQVHPDDAARLGLADGRPRRSITHGSARSRAGRGDRRDPARRRQPPPRLGPRRRTARRCGWRPSTPA